MFIQSLIGSLPGKKKTVQATYLFENEVRNG